MQIMPKISWPQRVASDADGRAEVLVAAVIIGFLHFWPTAPFSFFIARFLADLPFWQIEMPTNPTVSSAS